MIHNNDEVLKYWNDDKVESMYDKYLIQLEISKIKAQIKPGSKILDAGCGEGEGTLEYSKIPGVTIHAVDFSETRLEKAKERLKVCDNVTLKKLDFLSEHYLATNYDVIISQRFLINLMEWDLQKKVISEFAMRLNRNGKLLLMEGSLRGVDKLNQLRSSFHLDPIPVKWHNLFFDDDMLIDYTYALGLRLQSITGLGTYFLLTRGIRPYFDSNLNWDSEFNSIAASTEIAETLPLVDQFSRIKLFAFQK